VRAAGSGGGARPSGFVDVRPHAWGWSLLRRAQVTVSREAIRVPAVSFCGARPYSVGRRSPERRSGSTRPRQAAATRASAFVPGLVINIIKGFPNFSIGCCFGGWFNLYIRVPGAKGSIL